MEPRSYREFPMRISELGLIHRNEPFGTLHGLMHVRCCTHDDAYIFMTSEQIQNEIKIPSEVMKTGKWQQMV